MKRGSTGRPVTISTVGEHVEAFVPAPLPPAPPLEITNGLQVLLDQALVSLGRLDSVSSLLPDPHLFLYMYVRKEALLSSQIEGTQSSLSDLLLFEIEEAPSVPLDDVQEVSNYVAAINYGVKRIQEGFPLSLRLIREIHEVLLSKGRGSDKDPSEFRRSQNWIGGARPGNASFVPAPPEELVSCLGDLEKFLHDDPVKTPVLVKAALAHVQFETIHPFLDGNGRIGRLMITLLLCSEKILQAPVLYLSLYFKTHRQRYYELLDTVRREGDWEAWLSFFLEGVKETADLAIETAKKIEALFEADRKKIQGLGRAADSAMRVHKALIEKPILSITKTAEMTGLSFPTAKTALGNLEELGITHEITGQKRNRLFVYSRYLEILSKGTEVL